MLKWHWNSYHGEPAGIRASTLYWRKGMRLAKARQRPRVYHRRKA